MSIMESENKFVHLHVHSEYSLLDGSAKIKELIGRAKEQGMDSIAITDHGVMFGVIDFYKEALANGIKPILGCEVYVAPGSRYVKESSEKDNVYYHLVLLAETDEGYKNLMKLVSAGFTEGFYYKPRVDVELLREYKNGLIALSACLAGPVSKNLLSVNYAKGKEAALLYDGVFGRGNFFIELQDHGLPDERAVNPQLMRIAEETGIPICCTNDIHYIYRDDAKAHEVLLCIQTAKTMADEDRMNYGTDELYLKSPDEMYSLFGYAREGLLNTVRIAERCNVTIEFNKYKLPRFAVPENADAEGYLRGLCYDGLGERYADVDELKRERLEYELNTITKMGFTDYFLVVWDFIKYAKGRGIPVGPGRGSAGGSLVVYCLGITDIDPFRYDLIFERFMNPERVSMPDIDIDFCYERRQEVIDYVNMKYGTDHVAQIITFGTMAARACTRDVGRALGYPYAEVDRVAKMIPPMNANIENALKINPELRTAYEEEEQVKNLLDMAMRLEGLPRHASTHAAGVVICDEPVTEYVPLNTNDGVITTQFPKDTIEELGLLKMDLLGLRTLTVIKNAVSEISRNHKIEIDMDAIDYEDQKVYGLISSAKTEGVFQLESNGMKAFMKELEPDSLDEILAGISLYRPGPMDFIPKYVRGKKTREKITYTHESLEPILNSTYGCIINQEHVMQIARDLAGYSMGRSDLLRRAMSKKKIDVMAKERQNFVYGLGDDVPGCVKNNIPAEAAEKIFDEIAEFAKYAFPKPHAAAYAKVCYQTAWLKYYYPVEFMAALMTSVMDFTPKVTEYIAECKKMKIEVLPPDINESYGRFSVSGAKIRYGLAAVKNVGRPAIEALVSAREEGGAFRSLTHFINRMEARDINKRCVESLIKAGAFDSLGGKRSQYMAAYYPILNGVSQSKKNNIAGQMSLFETPGAMAQDVYRDALPRLNEYGLRETLEYEKEVLGVYLSGHPLGEYMDVLSKRVTANSLDFIKAEDEQEQSVRLADGASVTVGGLITGKNAKYTRSNKAMAFLTLEDLYGTLEVIVFPNIYERLLSKLAIDEVVVVDGKVTAREDEDAKLIADRITFYEDLAKKKPEEELWLKIRNGMDAAKAPIMDALATFPGDAPVILYDEKERRKHTLSDKFRADPDPMLLEKLGLLLGSDCVAVKKL